MWPHLSPARAEVLVVESDGEIVGTWAVLQIVHVEGLWIAPAHRKGVGVARRLLAAMRRTAREHGVSVVVTGCASDEVRALLDHVGAVRVPADSFALKVE